MATHRLRLDAWSLAKAAASLVCSSLLFSLTNGFNKLQEIFFMKQICEPYVCHIRFRKDRLCKGLNMLGLWAFFFLHAVTDGCCSSTRSLLSKTLYDEKQLTNDAARLNRVGSFQLSSQHRSNERIVSHSDKK